MTDDALIEELVTAINKHFDLNVELAEGNLPKIKKATIKGSLEGFLNEVVHIIESTDTDGKLNYYVDHALDFDTPEEYHRY